MPLDNKISNIIGVRAPEWLLTQLRTRSNQNSQDVRSNDNLLYLANKTAWVRLVSSVNVTEQDLNYFKTTLGEDSIKNPDDLAKKFVLFGGTSIYLNKDSYQLRYGLSEITPNQKKDGSYGMLGRDEIQRYGYRPMPGINSVTIETQGRLGSVKAATIQFKCWDKAQLDVIDALYFKLGYTMFLEWGHTYFYPSLEIKTKNRTFQPGKVYSTEFFSIDPFDDTLKGNKEEIYRRIAQNSRDSEGNYDAMLGMATNFNFTYNQEGGYDCTLKIIALGYLTDYIKINNPEGLPNLLREEVKKFNTLLEALRVRDEGLLLGKKEQEDKFKKAPSIFAYINTKAIQKGELKPEYQYTPREGDEFYYEPATQRRYEDIIIKYGIANSDVEETLKPNVTNAKEVDVTKTNSYSIGKKELYDFIFDDNYTGDALYIQKFGVRIPEEDTQNFVSDATLNKELIRNKITRGAYNKESIVENLWKLNNSNRVNIYDSYKIPYTGDNNQLYFLGIKITLGDKINSLISEKNAKPEFIPTPGGLSLVNSGILQTENAKKFLLKKLLEITLFGTDVLQSGLFPNDVNFSGPVTLDIGGVSEKVSLYTERKSILEQLFGVDSMNTTRINQTSKSQLFELSVKSNYEFYLQYNEDVKDPLSGFISRGSKKDVFDATIEISITDTALITNITPTLDQENLFLKYTAELEAQNRIEQTKADQANKQAASEDQENSPLYSMSTIESMLRTIQLYSLNRAIKDSGALNLGLRIRDIELGKDASFIQQLFSVGIFSNLIKDLLELEGEKILDNNYDQITNQDAEYRLKVHSKYGFATNLMANRMTLYDSTNVRNFKKVDFNKLLTTYVIPYEKSQNIENGTTLNHPVYIQFGALLMLLNHSCTLYDPTGKVKTPMVYIDFNPNYNFCLTNPQQLSTDPFTALIPFEGTDDDYVKLFDQRIISGYNIKKLSGQGQKDTPLFRPRGGAEDNRDYVSPSIPKFISSEGNGESIYKGRIMNILLNIDYLMDSIKSYTLNNGENKVFLKPFLEKILSDINKSIGNINVFRLSYNDGGNTLQIIDDQLIPADEKEVSLYLSSENNAELPLIGKNSIAKSLEIKTDISTRLSNMIAISSNSITGSKSTLSTAGDSFGFININYKDRYIENKKDVGDDDEAVKNQAQLDAEKRAAIQFNKAIKSFYCTPFPAEDQIPFSTNYFIDKITKIKGNDEATRASMMIPVAVNFTTDGISGFSPGHAFTIPNELLPYTYSTRKLPNGKNYIDRVGFVVFGLTHTIENNSWNTGIRANMIFLKDRDSYKIKESEIRQTGKFYATEDIDGKTPRNNNTPNADALRVVLNQLGYKEKYNKELSNWADISPAMSQTAQQLFKKIKESGQTKLYNIEITSGNDEFHQKSISYNSNHIYGNGIDFTVTPNTPQTRADINKVLTEFKTSNPLFAYDDEYKNQTKEATGGHFHIYINA